MWAADNDDWHHYLPVVNQLFYVIFVDQKRRSFYEFYQCQVRYSALSHRHGTSGNAFLSHFMIHTGG